MFEIKEALNGNAILTVTDGRGEVMFHETVREEEAETIGERVLSELMR